MGHTPGPWWVAGHGVRSHGSFVAQGIKATRFDGQDQRFEYETQERDANLRLIAAAPDLLAACKTALERFGMNHIGPTIDMLRDAIAKAEGRS